MQDNYGDHHIINDDKILSFSTPSRLELPTTRNKKKEKENEKKKRKRKRGDCDTRRQLSHEKGEELILRF